MGLAAPVPGQALMSRAPAIWERRVSEERRVVRGSSWKCCPLS